MDGNVVVPGAVQLSSQVLGHHVSTGGKTGAVREGSRVGNQAEGCAHPASDHQVDFPPVLHAASGRQQAGSLKSSAFWQLQSVRVSVAFELAEQPFPQPLNEEE